MSKIYRMKQHELNMTEVSRSTKVKESLFNRQSNLGRRIDSMRN